MKLLHVNVGSFSSWILKVLQSFFRLLRYFFHVFRPMACIILDAEHLKIIPCRGSYKALAVEDIKNWWLSKKIGNAFSPEQKYKSIREYISTFWNINEIFASLSLSRLWVTSALFAEGWVQCPDRASQGQTSSGSRNQQRVFLVYKAIPEMLVFVSMVCSYCLAPVQTLSLLLSARSKLYLVAPAGPYLAPVRGEHTSPECHIKSG